MHLPRPNQELFHLLWPMWCLAQHRHTMLLLQVHRPRTDMRQPPPPSRSIMLLLLADRCLDLLRPQALLHLSTPTVNWPSRLRHHLTRTRLRPATELPSRAVTVLPPLRLKLNLPRRRREALLEAALLPWADLVLLQSQRPPRHHPRLLPLQARLDILPVIDHISQPVLSVW